MSFAAHLAAADRAALDILGGPVRYEPAVGPPVDVRGMFDAAFVVANVGEAGVASTTPAVFLRLADLPNDPEEDAAATVEVDGVTYKAHTVKKDGQGGVLLLLHRE